MLSVTQERRAQEHQSVTTHVECSVATQHDTKHSQGLERCVGREEAGAVGKAAGKRAGNFHPAS